MRLTPAEEKHSGMIHGDREAASGGVICGKAVYGTSARRNGTAVSQEDRALHLTSCGTSKFAEEAPQFILGRSHW
jgi:hypothetical protein